MSAPPQLTLYTAAGCCLCDRLREQLAELHPEVPFDLREVDITSEPELEARYRAEIPVLLINGRKAVKSCITMEALRHRLLRAAGRGLAGLFRLR
jgi:glutaredoxin